MKRIFFSTLLFLCFFISCKKHNSTITKSVKNKDALIIEVNDLGVNMLKDFYYSCYVNEKNFNDNNLKRKFVSITILKRIDSLRNGENLILDYDPFIKGQDYNANIIKSTLEIKPLKNKNEFRVSFLLFGEKNEKKIHVDFLLQENKNGSFIICSILNDKYLNVADKNLKHKINLEENLHFNKWNGNYEGAFLRMPDESADPRSWATINIKVSKDSASLYLFSYMEEKCFKLTLRKVEKDTITFDMEKKNNVRIYSSNTKKKYYLESSYINNLMSKKETLELTKKWAWKVNFKLFFLLFLVSCKGNNAKAGRENVNKTNIEKTAFKKMINLKI